MGAATASSTAAAVAAGVEAEKAGAASAVACPRRAGTATSDAPLGCTATMPADATTAREAAAAAERERTDEKKARVRNGGVTRDDVRFDRRETRETAAGVPRRGRGGRTSRSNGSRVRSIATPLPTSPGRHPSTRRVTRASARRRSELPTWVLFGNRETHPRISARGASTCETGSLRAHLRRGAGSVRFLEPWCAACGSSRGK